MNDVVDQKWRWQTYAPGCYLLEDIHSRVIWAFGLRWIPTMGLRSRKLLLRQLHQEKIRWWSCPTRQASTVGFVPRAQQGARIDAKVKCAACQFALTHPRGTHVLRLVVASDQIWLVAVHDGNVLCQTDCWLVCPKQADQLEASIRERFPGVEVTHHDLQKADQNLSSSLVFLDASKTHQAATLLRLRVTRYWFWAVVFTIAMVICWSVWSRYFIREAAVQTQEQVHQTPKKMTMWRSAPGMLSTITMAWQDLPLNPFGWQLKGVACEFDVLRATCRAAYERTTRQANNQQLQSVAGAWNLEPVSLEQAALVRGWSMPAIAATPSNEPDDRWLIELQKFSPLVDQIEIGSVLTRSATPEGRVRSFRLSLPLRHLQQLDNLEVQVLWRSVYLELVPESASLPQGTRLRVFLQGDLVEHV